MTSRRVAVTAPTLVILDPRALRHLGDPKVENARFAQTRKISDDVHDNRHNDDPEAAQDQKRNRRHHQIDDEEIHRHTGKHLRPGQRAVNAMANEIAHRVGQKPPIDATRRGAPKMMNTPMITVPP